MNRASQIALAGTLVISCIGCDQATKAIAERHLDDQQTISLLRDTVRLSYVENAGAFLGLGAGLSPDARFRLPGVAVTVVLVLLAVHGLTDRTITFWRLLAIAALIGGGAGNLIDRASYGVVRDFLNVGIGAFRTGIFNVADVAVTAGVVSLIGISWRSRRPTDRRLGD